jgi:hypothetical protein
MTEVPEFKIGPDAQRIFDLMVQRIDTDNPIITLQEIEALTGRPIRRVRGSVYTARKQVRRDHHRWYASDPGIGYRLVVDEILPDCGKQNRSRARNLHRETLKILAVANPANQSVIARSRTVLERSIAELGLAATAPRAVSKVEQMVARSHNALTSEQQMQAIKDALGQKR